ncbi:hypothetical protein C5O26_10460, partial [Bacillus velezensis]
PAQVSARVKVGLGLSIAAARASQGPLQAVHQLAVAELAPPAHAHGLVDALVAINAQVVAQGKHLQRHAHVEPLDLYL